jgi:hypothetical protein
MFLVVPTILSLIHGTCNILGSELTPVLFLTHRKINKSPTTIENENINKLLTTPPVKRIDLAFPLGLTVTARNRNGVTIKDAVDAIYKQFRKKVCQFR